MKIYLSPSTQETNLCAMGDREEDHCNQIVDLIEPYLKASGVLFHRNLREMSHISSKDESNLYEPDLHYALHSNAANGTTRGHNVYICSKGGNAERFANILVSKQAEIYSLLNRVIVPTEKYTEIFYTDAPAVIDEIAFHDNAEDAKWIHDNMAAIAKNKAQAICEFFGVECKEPPKSISINELIAQGYTNITI